MALRALVWGTTGADLEYALFRAKYDPARVDWNFVEIERLDGRVCPIDPRDPAAVAGDGGERWAYAVYRAAP
jgi:hypothetical protein